MDALRPIIREEHAPAVHRLSFEVDMAELGSGFPIYWFALGRDGSFLDVERELLPA